MKSKRHQHRAREQYGEVIKRFTNRNNDKHINVLCIPLETPDALGHRRWEGIVQEGSWTDELTPRKMPPGTIVGLDREGMKLGKYVASLSHPLVRGTRGLEGQRGQLEKEEDDDRQTESNGSSA